MKVPTAVCRRQTPGRRGRGNDSPEREAEPGRRERLRRRDTGRQTLEQKLTRRGWLKRDQNQQEHQLERRQTKGDPRAGRQMEPVAGSQSSPCHRLVHFETLTVGGFADWRRPGRFSPPEGSDESALTPCPPQEDDAHQQAHGNGEHGTLYPESAA